MYRKAVPLSCRVIVLWQHEQICWSGACGMTRNKRAEGIYDFKDNFKLFIHVKCRYSSH